MTPSQLVQGQLDAYNAQDIEKFCAFYADDCVIADLNGAITQQGKAAIRNRYAAMFSDNPSNRAQLLGRMALGNVVIDHELVMRTPETRFEALAIYTVRNGLICRVDFAR